MTLNLTMPVSLAPFRGPSQILLSILASLTDTSRLARWARHSHERLRCRVNGRGEGEEPGRTGVSSGGPGSSRFTYHCARAAPGVSPRENPSAHHRTGTGDYVSRSVARRPGPSSC